MLRVFVLTLDSCVCVHEVDRRSEKVLLFRDVMCLVVVQFGLGLEWVLYNPQGLSGGGWRNHVIAAFLSPCYGLRLDTPAGTPSNRYTHTLALHWLHLWR